MAYIFVIYNHRKNTKTKQELLRHLTMNGLIQRNHAKLVRVEDAHILQT